MKDDDTIESVYEYDPSYSYSTIEMLTEQEGKTVSVRGYHWLLKYIVTSEAESTLVQVFADGTSRYCFADKSEIQITVETRGKKVTEKFDLRKVKQQRFDVDLTKNGFSDVNNEDIKVTCKVSVSDIQYCSEFIGTIAVYTAKSRPHDVILIVGGKTFYVHKLYLATWSRYFDKLFYGNFAEKNKNEVTLEDVDATEFEALLRLIFPDMHSKINDDNVLYLLKLGDRFDMPSVMAMCGNYLMDFENTKLDLIHRLELSDKYNLSQLQVACLKKVHAKSDAEFKSFLNENREKIRELSPNTLRNLI